MTEHGSHPLRITTEQRNSITRKLEQVFGPSIKAGPKAGHSLVLSAALLYKFLSDPWKSSDEMPSVAKPTERTEKREQSFADEPNLESFSLAFTRFRDAKHDLDVSDYLLMADFKTLTAGLKDLTGEEGYRSSTVCCFPDFLPKAVDLKQTNEYRKTNAQRALAVYNKMIRTVLDDFNRGIGVLDEAVFSLFETAGSIRNHEYRDEALAIAQQARDVHQKYEKMRELIGDGFDTRIDLLQKVVASEGVVPVRDLMEGAPEVARLNEEIDDGLRPEIRGLIQSSLDRFHALKGRTNMKTFPTEQEIFDATNSAAESTLQLVEP